MGIRDGVLTLLATGPRHGYQLKVELEAATGEIWSINVAQIYSTLTRLERDGLVTAEPEDADGRLPYALTDAGRDAARAWLLTAEDRTAPDRDELSMKLLVNLEAGLVPSAEVIEAQRVATLTALQDYTRLKVDADDLAWRLQLERLVMAAEAELKWLDRVEDHLADARPRSRSGDAAGNEVTDAATEEVRS